MSINNVVYVTYKSDCLHLLHSLNFYYPNFNRWLLSLNPDSTIVRGVYDNDHIVGIAIGKKSENEKKLRCVRVDYSYRNQNIGHLLIDDMLDQLECRKPLVSVSEEMLSYYSPSFVNRYGFRLDSVDKGLYRKGKIEYFFNKTYNLIEI